MVLDALEQALHDRGAKECSSASFKTELCNIFPFVIPITCFEHFKFIERSVGTTTIHTIMLSAETVNGLYKTEVND